MYDDKTIAELETELAAINKDLAEYDRGRSWTITSRKAQVLRAHKSEIWRALYAKQTAIPKS